MRSRKIAPPAPSSRPIIAPLSRKSNHRPAPPEGVVAAAITLPGVMTVVASVLSCFASTVDSVASAL